MQAKRIGLIAATAVVLSAGTFGIWFNSTKSALPDAIVMSNGRLEAERIDVASKQAGRVAEVLVAEGDWVEEGTLVARMETTQIDAQLRQTKAAAAQAEQQKIQAEALLQQRLTEESLAKVEYERAKTLAENGHASQELVDQRESALSTATAAVASARAGIDLADATIESSTAATAQSQSVRNDADLTTPRNGRVQYVLKNVGEVVSAGGTVVTLTDLTDMYMSIYLPAQEAGLLQLGSEARIILDPIPDYVIPARVSFVASTAQFTPKSVETADEREQLMFRVKLTIPADLLKQYEEQAKAGVAGVGYVRTDETVDWPEALAVTLPK